MTLIRILPWILIVLGIVLNFIVPKVLKKNAEKETIPDSVYQVKSFAMVLVVIGCIMIFWLGGKFGV